MKTSQALLTLAIGLVSGIGLAIAVPVLAQSRGLYTKEVVKVDAGWVENLNIIEDRKRNRVCYITYTTGGRDHAMSCVILDQNNPR